MDKLRRALSGNDDSDEVGIVSQISDATSLSFKTRLICFGVCFGIGLLLSIGGTIAIFFLNYVTFAILYTIGNLTSMGSTLFLMGPFKQLKKMFAMERLFATIGVFVFMILTIIMAVVVKSGILALIFCFLQFLALCCPNESNNIYDEISKSLCHPDSFEASWVS